MAEPTTPTAPPAPAAPAPAATPPSSATSAAPKADAQAAPSLADSFDALDSKVKAASPPKATEKKPDKPPEEQGKEGQPTVDKTDRKAKDPKELRTAYERAERELGDTRTERDSLRKKIEDFERKGRDTTVLSEQLAVKEKELASTRAELRAMKQEASPEFKDKYDKPFNTAAEFAKRQIEQLTVTDAEGQPERRATWEDFAALYQMPYSAAIARAKEKFGDAASVVVQHMSDLQKLDYQRSVALKEERDHASERQKADDAKRIQETEAIQHMYIKVNEELAEKHPEWYQPDPEDKEGNELLSQGLALVDHQPATWQEKVIRDSNIRLKAAAFPRMVLRVQRLQNELAELKNKLGEYEGSEPGATLKPTGDTPATTETDWRDDLKKSVPFQ